MGVRQAFMAGLLVVGSAGAAFAVDDILDFLANFEDGYLLIEESEEDGNEWPTITVDAGPASAGNQVTDFEIQGHTGGVDITLAKLTVRDGSGQDTCYVADLENEGIVVTPEGSRVSFLGVSVPTNSPFVKLEWTCLGETYHRIVEDAAN